jgi:hypothetical protein
MTHRLSGIQEQILALCLEQKFVTSQELLSALWDLQPQEHESKKDTISKAQYAAGHAGLSRSLTRLWRRRLVRIWKGITGSGTGVSLTSEGQTVIQGILAEAEKNEIPVNRR